LRKIEAEDVRFLAEILESVAVVPFERQAVELHETGPVVLGGNSGLLVVRRTGTLVVHLEEEKIGELFDVVAVGDPIVAKQVAVIPDLVDETGSGGRHQTLSGGAITVSSGNTSKSRVLKV
jgi:hypothetical protein